MLAVGRVMPPDKVRIEVTRPLSTADRVLWSRLRALRTSLHPRPPHGPLPARLRERPGGKAVTGQSHCHQHAGRRWGWAASHHEHNANEREYVRVSVSRLLKR